MGSFWSRVLAALAAAFRRRTSTMTDTTAATSGPPPWMPIAERELGLTETPGPRSTPRILELRRIAGCPLTGDDGAVAWCKIFVNAVLVLAGIPIVRDWMARSVERDPNFLRLPGPAYGAIVSFWRISRASGLGHTGFYVGETATRIRVLGGNQSDAVRLSFFLRRSPTFGLVGYYWPKSLPLPNTAAIRVDDTGEPVASAL
jgi:uncharacterized protein (TIGR02594 family)